VKINGIRRCHDLPVEARKALPSIGEAFLDQGGATIWH